MSSATCGGCRRFAGSSHRQSRAERRSSAASTGPASLTAFSSTPSRVRPLPKRATGVTHPRPDPPSAGGPADRRPRLDPPQRLRPRLPARPALATDLRSHRAPTSRISARNTATASYESTGRAARSCWFRCCPRSPVQRTEPSPTEPKDRCYSTCGEGEWTGTPPPALCRLAQTCGSIARRHGPVVRR